MGGGGGGDIAIIASSSRSRSLRDLRQTLDLDPSLTIKSYVCKDTLHNRKTIGMC